MNPLDPPRPLATAAGAPRVLLAEDDPSLRSLIAGVLRDDGFEVTEVPDGNAFVDLLADSVAADGSLVGYDLIVSDVRMPGFTALEIMAGMRRLFFRMPVVLITAFGDPRTHQRARQLGAAAVFDKPFDLDDLRASVAKLLPRFPLGGKGSA
jgi:DNA-binding response OmpR family regulator